MKTRIQRCFVFASVAASVLGAAACGARTSTAESQMLSASQPIGQFRGHVAINLALQSALLDPSDVATTSFDFAYFAIRSGLFLDGSNGLQPLLGMWTTGGIFGGGETAFNNGAPTAISTYLYESMMANLSERLGLACTEDSLSFVSTDGSPSPRRYLFRAEFLGAARTFCTADSPRDGEDAARDLWHLIVGYEYDESFGTLFDLVALTPDYGNLAPEQRLELLLHTMLLHPVFLINY